MPFQPSHLHLVGAEISGHGEVPLDDPIAVFEMEHDWKLELCDALELIADGLPNTAQPALCRSVVHVLRVGLPQHVALEEQLLFPALRRSSQFGVDCERVLRALEQEHESDDPFAHEIADELEQLAGGDKPRNSEMLGYMLRGFFIPLRRHINWENVTVLPTARRVLSPDQKMELASHLNDNWRVNESDIATISDALAQAKEDMQGETP
ncbi:MAG: hemerythrin domain-containing protein [Filomicrobium sp.]